MAGLGYTFSGPRRSVTVSLVGGPSFNGLSLGDRFGLEDAAIDIGNSFALRAGASAWWDLNRRIALNGSVGFLRSRPTLTVLEDGAVRHRPLRGDAVLLSAGLAYKLF
jgi:hypothetical protein